MNRPPTEKEWQKALRLLERLANPSGSWRDDENRRLANRFVKKMKNRKPDKQQHHE